MLADSHCHLLDEKLFVRREEIAANLRGDGLEFIVEVGTGIAESLDAYEFSKTHDGVYCTLGVHPHYASEYFQGDYSEETERLSTAGRYGLGFESWAKEMVGRCESKIVAIGECGLDYFHNFSPKDVQKQAFIRQINLARELGLPLVIHSRDSFEDTFKILKEHAKGLSLQIHCFGYGAKELVQLSDEFGSYFSFGGAVTYTKCVELREALRVCPMDRLLLETDAPYLAPCELRGKVNEPRHVRKVAEFIAKELGMPFDEVARITLGNTKRFYGIV